MTSFHGGHSLCLLGERHRLLNELHIHANIFTWGTFTHNYAYSYGSPHMAAQKQDDQHEHTFSSYVRIQDVVLNTYLGRWTIGRSGERGSGISVLPARYDDDDEILTYIHIHTLLSIYIHIRIRDTISRLLKFHMVFVIFRRSYRKNGQSSVYIAWSLVKWNEVIALDISTKIADLLFGLVSLFNGI